VQSINPYALTTSSGRQLDLSNPAAADLAIEDVARALSKICRFGAQATAFYSVAQHAMEVAARVPQELQLAALHHDSHEAFAGDLPTPLKKLMRQASTVYDEICTRLDAAIADAFGIDPRLFKHEAVAEADEVVRIHESAGLLADGGVGVRDALPGRQVDSVTPIQRSGRFGRLLTPDEAEHEFISTHTLYSASR
jgi:hypothetical protein